MRNNKFDDETREEIVLDYISGVKIDIIAKRYGISNSYPGALARKFGYAQRISQRERSGWRRAMRAGAISV